MSDTLASSSSKYNQVSPPYLTTYSSNTLPSSPSNSTCVSETNMYSLMYHQQLDIYITKLPSLISPNDLTHHSPSSQSSEPNVSSYNTSKPQPNCPHLIIAMPHTHLLCTMIIKFSCVAKLDTLNQKYSSHKLNIN